MAPRKMQDKMINKIEDIQPLQGAFKSLAGGRNPCRRNPGHRAGMIGKYLNLCVIRELLVLFLLII